MLLFSVVSPLLDACVLAILEEKDTYGYALTQRLKSQLELSESALYPVLRRLCATGALSTYDKEIQGRNRRYYSITNMGKTMLNRYKNEWETYKNRVEALLLAGVEPGENPLFERKKPGETGGEVGVTQGKAPDKTGGKPGLSPDRIGGEPGADPGHTGGDPEETLNQIGGGMDPLERRPGEDHGETGERA